MTGYPRLAVERAMKVQEVILRAMSGQYHWFQAAEILGVSCRTMRRWKWRYERQGYDGLYDRRRKRPSPRKVPLALAERMLRLFREKYFDFNVRHFHDILQEEHGITLSYSWVKAALQGAGLVVVRRRRGPHRKRRPRRPLTGMLLHLDGSQHRWLPLDGQQQTLLTLMDDATSKVYYSQLVSQESTRTVMRALRCVVQEQGLFCSLYTDRAGHFFYTPKAGQGPDRERPTQVARALKQLGIELIPAGSPQARGRGERLFGTWQGRLPQELRLRDIRTFREANQYLRKVFIPFHNRRFAVEAEQKGTAFVKCRKSAEELERVFSLHHNRVVGNDNTVRVKGRRLQIERSPWRFHFVRCRVTVYEHLDGTFSVGYGPHIIGRYDASGNPLKNRKTPRKNQAA
ncbi:MAG: ISNCY family transposase [Candidatus Methylomirabilales bacterium]